METYFKIKTFFEFGLPLIIFGGTFAIVVIMMIIELIKDKFRKKNKYYSKYKTRILSRLKGE